MAHRGQEAVAEPRPLLRGAFHGAAAVAAPFGLVALLIIARSPSAYAGAAIFASSLILLYGTSATYHLVRWRPRPAGVMERIDHSMIFVLIAGTYTPFCLVVLSPAWGIPMLSVVWSLAAAGILLQVCWRAAPRWVSVGSYIVLGWTGVVAASQVVASLPLTALCLLIAGGILYSAGALVYATRRPDPFPRTFGYHEVFHVFVIAGTLLHFSVIAVYVLPS
jgi:hemolysin III